MIRLRREFAVVANEDGMVIDPGFMAGANTRIYKGGRTLGTSDTRKVLTSERDQMWMSTGYIWKVDMP